MAQFDVSRNPNPDSADAVPYLLDIQADLLDGLNTRVVVPLLTKTAMGKTAKILNPMFNIENQQVVMSTAELAGVSVRSLGDKVCSVAQHRDEIIAALDLLFTGI
jgi:toxin CcdB